MNSVIVLNWNGKNLLEACLKSLDAQRFRDFECIVVDNGSSDGSVEYLKNNFPHVKRVALPKNLGFAAGCNAGIRASQGTRVVLLNNDAEAEPDWLGELNRALDQNPSVGFCASKMLNFYERNLLDSAGDGIVIGNAYKRGELEPDGPQFSREELVFSACAGAAIYRREMLEKIGLFDEVFHTDLEDVDLGFRAQLQGYQCLYVPSAVVYHHVGFTRKKAKFPKNITVRNRYFFWFKNAPRSILFETFPALWQITLKKSRSLTAPTTQSGVGSRQDTVTSMFWFFGQLLWHAPHLFKERWRIQRRKVMRDEELRQWISKGLVAVEGKQ